MRILTIDFETFYDSEYTLSKMTTEAYVRDRRFKAHMVGIKNGDGATIIVPGDQIQSVFGKIPWHETMVLAQHAHFEALIMSHHYGVKPAFWLDTLSMFRALHPAESASLHNQTQVLGLPAKGNGYDIISTKGIETLSPSEFEACAKYCKLDCDLTKRIFDILKSMIPVSEFKLIDLTVRMFSEPIFILNQELLSEAHKEEIDAKAALMARVVHDKDSLSSNPKFAQILLDLGIDPPKKISPAAIKNGRIHPDIAGEPPVGLIASLTKKEKAEFLEREGYPHESDIWTYAFGKSDEAFKRLLDHDSPEVQALMEARFGVKSTIKQTRTERFISAGSRGPLPVYLHYAGAHTLRWSGGDKMNMQNLNRGSKLRESIEAPPGYMIVVRDLSAIEARVNAWVSGQEDMVETFRRGEDIYCQMASSIVGRHVTKEDKGLRFMGKAVVLGCLGADTLVLTNRGYIPIVSVQLNDMVWDGVEWVNHQGVIQKGRKTTVTAFGLTATEDHEILTEHGWKEWKEVHTNPFLFQSALSTASLPLSDGNATRVQRDALAGGTQLSSVPAGGKDMSTEKTSQRGALQDVINAPSFQAQQPENITGGMRTSSRTKPIEQGSLIESQPALVGAITATRNALSIMGGAVYLCTSLGGQIGKHFLRILSRFKVGMRQNLNLIGWTTKKDMSRETYASSLERKIATTEEQSQKCSSASTSLKQKCETYDIAYSGSRSRFTVLTASGPLLVHNCGYGLGWKKFQQMLRIGMLGDTGRLLGRDIADPLGVNLEGFMHRFSGYVQESLPPGVDIQTHALHCACTEAIIRAFRDNKPMIPRFWQTCQASFDYIMRGESFSFGTNGVISTCKEGLAFPSGAILRYVELEAKSDGGKRKEYSILKNRRKGERGKLYGGLCCENIVQRLARDIIADNMRAIAPRYRIATMTHDEIVCVVPEQQAEECYDFMGEVMGTPPAWAPDLPLASEGGFAHNYSK